MNILLITGIIALILGIVGMPYGYYFLLRTLICIIFFKCLFDIYAKENLFDNKMYFLLALAIIYNPIFPLPLGKTIWTIVNIITILTLIYLIHNEKMINKL